MTSLPLLSLLSPELLTKLKNIKLAIFDVDGVLTDGSLYYDNHGNEFKAFNAKDGHGMKLLQQSGIPIAIITARNSVLVEKRMKDLGINFLFQNSRDKLVVFQQLIAELNLSAQQVCYVGDDLLDLPVMHRVGLSIAVQDAHFAVKERADWITQAGGGKGAAREVCDLILSAQDKLDTVIAHHLAP